MRLLALLVLVPSLVLAQGLNASRPGLSESRVLASFPLSTTGCLATGTGGVTISRASKGTVNANGDGYTLTECANNELRVSPDGVAIEAVRKNWATYSDALSVGTNANTNWLLANATVETVAGAPVGGTWAEVTSTASAGALYGNNPTVTSTTTLVWSVYAAKASGTGSAGIAVRCGGVPTGCTCTRSDGGTCSAQTGGASANDCRGAVTDLGTTPIRITVVATCPGAVTSTYPLMFPGAYGSGTGTTRFGAVDLVANATLPASHVPTTSAAVEHAADQVSVTVPAVGSKWCIAGNFKPFAGVWPNALSLWTLGDNYNSANTASSWGNSSIYIVDKDSGVKDLGDYTDPVAPWRIVTCNNAGSLSLAVNGVVVDETATGAGTGILTTPSTTLRLGAQVNGGTPFGGWIKGVKVCAAKKPSECKP